MNNTTKYLRNENEETYLIRVGNFIWLNGLSGLSGLMLTARTNDSLITNMWKYINSALMYGDMFLPPKQIYKACP